MSDPISDERLAEIKAYLASVDPMDHFASTWLALLARLDKAEAALRPFAEAGGVLYGPNDADYVVTHYDDVKGDRGLVTLGDFRRAHSVFTPPPPKGS